MFSYQIVFRFRLGVCERERHLSLRVCLKKLFLAFRLREINYLNEKQSREETINGCHNHFSRSEVAEKRTSRVSRRAKLKMQLQDKLLNSFIHQRGLLINGNINL